jgi:hypothetical protein
LDFFFVVFDLRLVSILGSFVKWQIQKRDFRSIFFINLSFDNASSNVFAKFLNGDDNLEEAKDQDRKNFLRITILRNRNGSLVEKNGSLWH